MNYLMPCKQFTPKCFHFQEITKTLKGKFSSGIEGTLASTLIRDFNWKQLSEIILCIFCDVFKVYLINIDSETAEHRFKDYFKFCTTTELSL